MTASTQRRVRHSSGRFTGSALLATAAAIATSAVQAQNVTLGGVADAAVRQVRNTGSGSVTSLVSGSNATSRIVIRGTEDLGGGLSAGFWLEHGLLLDTGTPASSTMFFDRRSTVSLADTAWGEIRVGRDFVPSYMNWSRYDPFSYVGVAGSNNLVSAAGVGPIRSAFSTSPNTTMRASDSVQWLLPAGWGGLEGGVMLAAREGGTAADGKHKVTGLRLGWANKQFGVSAASTRSENNLTHNPTTGGRFADHALGANADFGMVRVSIAVRRFAQANARQTNTLVGLWVPLGLGELKFSWNRANLEGRVGNTAVHANDAQQFGLGYVYSLSKRSALYGTLSRLDNRGNAVFVIPGGGALAAGGKSNGVELGLRHNF